MALNCGNPVAAASIKEGERILDLGSGGGMDVLLAASKVGATGQIIGLDMSSDMVFRARRNAQKQNLHPPQVAFVQASLTEPLPISSDSIHYILSSSVINLLPVSGKVYLFKETFRVLKPGGRIVLDAIVAKKFIPDDIRDDLASRVGCIAGAIELDAYQQLLVEAGLTDIVFLDTGGDLNVYTTLSGSSTSDGSTGQSGDSIKQDFGPSVADASQRTRRHFDANEWVASYQINALKPTSSGNPTVEAPEALLRWWDAYPSGKSLTELISIDEVASLIKRHKPNESDYVVIDVRRNDHAGGHVRNSTQCPAQTFYDDLPDFFEKFGQTAKVIFYCGSSKGRGPRCARWYQDYLNDNGIISSKGYVLQGGIKAWLNKFGEDLDLVDND